MSRYNHKHKLGFKAYFYRTLFSAIVIAALVVCMPYGNTSSFRYQKGEPWEDEAFIAQDSFPILKLAEQVAHEQDSLKQFYEPYFRQDVDIMEQQLAGLQQDFLSLSPAAPHYFLPHLLKALLGIVEEVRSEVFTQIQLAQMGVIEADTVLLCHHIFVGSLFAKNR